MSIADGHINVLGIEGKEAVATNQSAFCLSQTSKQAFEWRLMLIDLAQKKIDLQYFIWHNDFSGRLLFYRLLHAANRGVKVRFLVDDMPLGSDADRDVAYADHHPNIDIKIFNPTTSRIRRRRLVEYITNAGKLNHRMHNKLLIVDNDAAIIGGRNIGDEYFGLHDEMNFADLDGIIFGKAARAAGASFQSYWQSEWAIDAKKVFPQNDGNEQKKFLVELEALTAETKKLEQFSLEPIDWRDSIIALKKRIVPGLAESIQDDPTELNISHMSLAGKAIDRIANKATKELCISSPYFIPGRSMLKNFRALVERGVKIKILTNSLMTNNHIAAHSGYIKFRKKVLSRGIELYEFHHAAQLRDIFDTPPIHSNLLSLHVKTVIIDRKKVFVGSFNFDPRAIYLNSEVGLMIDSPALAENAAEMFDRLILPENSWRVTMQKSRRLLWSSNLGEFRKEPMRDVRQKLQLMLLYLLPIEKQL